MQSAQCLDLEHGQRSRFGERQVRDDLGVAGDLAELWPVGWSGEEGSEGARQRGGKGEDCGKRCGGSGECGGVGGAFQARQFACAGGGQQCDDDHEDSGEKGDGDVHEGLPLHEMECRASKVTETLFDGVHRRKMNTPNRALGGRQVRGEQNGNDSNPALTELRGKLNDGLARSRVDRKNLPALSRLGRTTVWEALTDGEPVPSAKTVAALARALKLPAEELLALQREAAAGGHGKRPAPGRPIGEWEPHTLEVHPARSSTLALGNDQLGARALPGYVQRPHDRVLAEVIQDAAAGRSRMVVLVGGSSTGKTRACWEAVQPLASMGWRLWHPFYPSRAEAALDDLHRVAPRTVVWLNEAQHYLGDREAGERIAASLHGLLTSPEHAPVLVLGTLWPEYAVRYAALPSLGKEDAFSRVRELLSGRTLTVPDTFDAQALATATALARGGDRLLADALTRAGVSGLVAQDLAGAPELLNRYERATPAARAVLEAAMDARRLGVGLHLPQAFLSDAAADYLTDADYDRLTNDWAEQAYAELAEPVHGRQAPLHSTTPRPRRRPLAPVSPSDSPHPAGARPMVRLADYLEEHGRTARKWLCPPASFWHAALTHLTQPNDLDNLAEAAENRHRLQWAHHLRHRAADEGSTSALYRLAAMREEAGDRESAEHLARRAAELGKINALYRLTEMREEAGDHESAENLARQVAGLGSTSALHRLAKMREEAGDRESAENLVRQAADQGDTAALYRLAMMREDAGDRESAESLLRQAAEHGETTALLPLAEMREDAGDQGSAENLARQAAEHGETRALLRLGKMREQAGDHESAENLFREAADHGDSSAFFRLAMMWLVADQESVEGRFRQAAEHGNINALYHLVRLREEAGDRKSAEDLARQAAEHGDTLALYRLTQMREEAGDRKSAEDLARQAAEHGTAGCLYRLAEMRKEAGDRESAENLFREAANRGGTEALYRLAEMREVSGDRESFEDLFRQAADHGDPMPLYYLVMMREEAGDHERAEDLARQAADHGSNSALHRLAEIRQKAGDHERAENLLRHAADHGSTIAFERLAEMRQKARDQKSAENLLRKAADHGKRNVWDTTPPALTTRWPNGLDPDGTPTPPWQ
ncbi:hypothetical protein [Streptomyces canus]|uniref:hypothetical protein n=1 Tax=Streptomyces canus TaxID=58343 RepID=UPI003CEE6033